MEQYPPGHTARLRHSPVRGLLLPGSEIPSRYTVSTQDNPAVIWSNEMLQAVQNGTLHFFLLGYLRYTHRILGTFTVTNETGFCYRYSVATSNSPAFFAGCGDQEYEYAN